MLFMRIRSAEMVCRVATTTTDKRNACNRNMSVRCCCRLLFRRTRNARLKIAEKSSIKENRPGFFFFLNCFFFAFLLFLFHSASFFMFCKKNVSFCELRVFFLCITHGARMCAQMELRRFSSFAHRFCVLYYYCE